MGKLQNPSITSLPSLASYNRIESSVRVFPLQKKQKTNTKRARNANKVLEFNTRYKYIHLQLFK